MSEPTFTPGPWHMQVHWHCPSELKGAMIYCFDSSIGVSPRIAAVSALSVGSQERCNANAHLIAAAPELYQCLATAVATIMRLNDQLASGDTWRDADWDAVDNECLAAKELLAKARGEGA